VFTRGTSQKPGQERGSLTFRRLDRYAGIPLIATLGLFRSAREKPSTIKRVGLLKTAGIGDTILLSAIVNDLRRAIPDAHLVLFTGAENHAAGLLLDSLDAVVKLPLKNPVALRERLRQYRFDAFLDFGPWPRINALIAAMAHAQYTIGFRTAGQYRHYAYDLAVSHSDQQHELENYRGIVRALGIKTSSPPALRSPLIPVGTLPFSSSDTRYSVFHLWPGGFRSNLREWPAERWVTLAQSFRREAISIVLTGAPADREKNEVVRDEMRRQGVEDVHNVAGCSLAETAAIVAAASIVVSVNTGVMHIAAALGIPVVGVHGPTNSRRWGPVGPRAASVNAPLEGCGYLNLGFEYQDALDCMGCISVDQVWLACAPLLQECSTASDASSAWT